MGLLDVELHPRMLKTIEEIKQQNEMNIDEYTKGDRRPTDIQSFYAGKSVFLTGATGFMGKCFVEKLLRDCPELRKLYLLVRPRKEAPVEEKMKKYFSNVIFDRLRKIDPNFESKVVAVKGDLQQEKLGLSEEDRQLLIDNVDIMVHNGATVRFNEAVSVALRINVLGTRDMLELAMACKHMQVFVYVSTAYSHCYRKHIKEEFYEPPADLKIVKDMIVADEEAKYGMSEEDVNQFLGKWPNIYTFTKSIAEDLVRQYGEKSKFACCVFRPSIVLGAYKEPLIGWIGNRNGPTTAFLGSALGVIHAVYNTRERFDAVPVDYSINALIASIYDSAKKWENDKRPKVYNFGSSMANPTTVKSLYDGVAAMGPTLGSEKSVWHISTIFTSSKLLFYILHFIVHFIPAVFGDIALLIMRKKPRTLSLFFTGTKNLDWIMYFMNFGWLIQASEMRKVFDNISEADRKLFDFNIWDLDWLDFNSRYICGVRTFILKEPLDNIERTRKRFAKMRLLHYVFLTVVYLLIAYYAMKLVGIIN